MLYLGYLLAINIRRAIFPNDTIDRGRLSSRPLKQGNPVERRRRKVTGLKSYLITATTAGPPESRVNREPLFSAHQVPPFSVAARQFVIF